MDQTLQAAFLARSSPFSLVTLRSTPSLTPSQLLAVSNVISRFVATYFPAARLRVLDDWHSHDGYVTDSEATTLSEIGEWFRSEEALLASDQGDSHVHKAIYSESLEMLWRWNIEDERDLADGDLWCSFDFTAPAHDVFELSKMIGALAGPGLTRVPASEHFARNYAG